MRQIREIQPTGLPVDALFADHPAKYTVDGCDCGHAHTLEEAEECQDGRCPVVTAEIHRARLFTPEMLATELERVPPLPRETWWKWLGRCGAIR